MCTSVYIYKLLMYLHCIIIFCQICVCIYMYILICACTQDFCSLIIQSLIIWLLDWSIALKVGLSEGSVELNLSWLYDKTSSVKLLWWAGCYGNQQMLAAPRCCKWQFSVSLKAAFWSLRESQSNKEKPSPLGLTVGCFITSQMFTDQCGNVLYDSWPHIKTNVSADLLAFENALPMSGCINLLRVTVLVL